MNLLAFNDGDKGMTDSSYLDFCNYIACESLSLDEKTRMIECCSCCKAYQLFNFFVQSELHHGDENNLKFIESHRNANILTIYKRALKLACGDVKDYKLFCPKFYKMRDCTGSVCPDSKNEWTCWALAYLEMSRKLESSKGHRSQL